MGVTTLILVGLMGICIFGYWMQGRWNKMDMMECNRKRQLERELSEMSEFDEEYQEKLREYEQLVENDWWWGF